MQEAKYLLYFDDNKEYLKDTNIDSGKPITTKDPLKAYHYETREEVEDEEIYFNDHNILCNAHTLILNYEILTSLPPF